MNTDLACDLLASIEQKIFIGHTENSALSTVFIEILAIGQAVARSDDFARLAKSIREHTSPRRWTVIVS